MELILIVDSYQEVSVFLALSLCFSYINDVEEPFFLCYGQLMLDNEYKKCIATV